MKYFLGVFVFLFPVAANAGVSISEVAWMGSAESANYEWIELHNDGAAIDATDWVLTDSQNLQIVLAGVIPADAYVVLERTSDDSAAGSAFLIYTGALVNTGATLRLERADGSLVDQVVGGEGWEHIGGDNVTKETAQHTSAGWVTAAATPGRAITTTKIEGAAADNPETPSVDSARRQGSVTRVIEPLQLPGVTLELEVTAPAVGYVHQAIPFTVDASGIGDSLIDSLQYEWNFGDGFTARQQTTEHVYQYPGTYVVTVYGGYKRQEQVARHEVTILPVAVSLTSNDAGDVQVNNDSPYEIDLSGFRVRGDAEFLFPDRTILLPNQTITIPQQLLGKTTNKMIAVYDAESALAAALLPGVSTEESPKLALAEPVVYPMPVPQVSSISTDPPAAAFGFATVESAPTVIAQEKDVQTKEVVVATSSQVAAAAVPNTSSVPWAYLGLAGVLTTAIVGVLAVPRRNERS